MSKHQDIFNQLTPQARAEFLISIPAHQRKFFAYGRNAGKTVQSKEETGGYGGSKKKLNSAEAARNAVLKLLRKKPMTVLSIAKVTKATKETTRDRLNILKSMGLVKTAGCVKWRRQWVAL